MAQPKPITLVSGDADDFQADPQPFALVGDLPVSSEIAALAAVGTADATDEASAILLVNAVKARLNQVIAALKA